MSDIDPKLSRLYREVSTEGPPPALDAALLAAARLHLAKPKRRELPWWSHWLVPASLMATLVMGVSITLLITQEHSEIVEGDTVRHSSAPPRAAESEKVRREPSPATPPVPPAEIRIVTPSAADAVQVERHAKDHAIGVMRETNISSDTVAGLGASAPPAPSASKVSPMRSQTLPRSPEAWLDDIRQLIREGRAKEVVEQLAEFRKVYPGVTIPEDLGR